MNRHFVRAAALSAVVIVGLLSVSSPASAQTDPVYDAKGLQRNHDYFSSDPFESIDVGTGALILTYTDLVLPGNAGFDVKFQRTYSNKDNSWSYGIAGLVMSVGDSAWPPPPPSDLSPWRLLAPGDSPRQLMSVDLAVSFC